MRLTTVVLCLLPLLTVAVGNGVSADDASALLQGRAALAGATEASVDVEAMRSLVATFQADLAKRMEGQTSEGTSEVALSTIRPALRRATRFVADSLAKSNVSRAIPGATCGAYCVIAIVLDSAAILFEGGLVWTRKGGHTCSAPVVLMWWITGLLTLTIDQKTTFPEAVHQLAQMFTGVAYGSSPPQNEPGLSIFHGVHSVVSQMGVARVTGEAMGQAFDLIGASAGPKSAIVALALSIAAGTLWFTSDLHGSGTTGPTWDKALLNGFYQCLITSNGIGYGDFSLTTDWGKLLSPIGLTFMAQAWGNFAASFADESGDDGDSDKAQEICRCFGRNICKGKDAKK